MQTGEVIKLYEVGLRGRPIRTVRPGDLAEPGARSLWQRIAAFGKTIAQVAREAGELETRLLKRGYYRRGGGW